MKREGSEGEAWTALADLAAQLDADLQSIVDTLPTWTDADMFGEPDDETDKCDR